MSKAAERDIRATYAELDAQRHLSHRRHAREVETARDELKDLIISKYVHKRHSYHPSDAKRQMKIHDDMLLEDVDPDQDRKPAASPGLFPGGCRNSLSLRRFLADEKAALKARLSPTRLRRKLVSQQAKAQVPFPEHIIKMGKSTTAILRDYDEYKQQATRTQRSDDPDECLCGLAATSMPHLSRSQWKRQQQKTNPAPAGASARTSRLVIENARRIRQQLDFDRMNTLSSELGL